MSFLTTRVFWFAKYALRNETQGILTAVKHEAYAVSGRSQKSLDHFTGHRSTRPRSECPENRYSGPDIFQLTISPLE